MTSPTPSLYTDSQLSSYLEYHTTLYAPDTSTSTPLRRHYIQYENIMEMLKRDVKMGAKGDFEALVREIVTACNERDAYRSRRGSRDAEMSLGSALSHETHVPGHGLTILSPHEEVHVPAGGASRPKRRIATYGSMESSHATRSSSQEALHGSSQTSSRSSSPPQANPHNASHHPILALIHSDLHHVHECYISHVNNLQKRLNTIDLALSRIDATGDLDLLESNESPSDLNISLDASKATIKKYLESTYRHCRFIENYCQLNRTVLRQVCKQLHIATLIYMKKYGGGLALQRVQSSLEASLEEPPAQQLILTPTTAAIITSFTHYSLTPFTSLEGIDEIMNRLHSLYAQNYCASDPDKALSELSKPQIKHSPKDVFKFAFTIGTLLPLVVFLLGLLLVPPSTIEVRGFWDVFPVFRFLILIILYIWLYGLDVYIWQKRKVNFQYILELDPSATLDHIKVWKTAAIFTSIWAIYFLLYLGHAKGKLVVLPIDLKWYPLAATATLVTICLLPVHVFHLGARITIFKVIKQLIILPFGECKFVHNFAADVFTSMAVPLGDISYSICYYTTNAWSEHAELNQCREWNSLLGPCLVFLPYYWRLLQCLRVYHDTRQKAQLINAGKYLSSLIVILLNALHSNIEASQQWGVYRIFWIIVVIISTLYSYSWDITMDWGLFQLRKGTLLRPKLMYPKIFYPCLAIFNLFARFAWAGTLTSYISSHMYFLTIFFGAVEILRRGLWSIVRLEWAQISNAEKYRKSRFVPDVDYEQDGDDAEDDDDDGKES